MEYLLVNHVPFGRGSGAGSYLVGDMWLEDLRAQQRAIARHGRLHVATPLLDALRVEHSGSFNLVEIDLRDEGFEYHPLPSFLSMKQFVSARARLHNTLEGAVARVSVVQADYGGHPIALGRLVWPIAKRRHKKRIWLFDGADPFPRLQRAVREERGLWKRLARTIFVWEFEHFCGRAIRSADLVFAHNDAVVRRFASAWHSRCHLFPRSFLREGDLIDEYEQSSRWERLLDRQHPLHLGVAGRQIAIKGTDHVLRAMAVARSRGVDLRLTILGEGQDLPAFRQLALDLGLSSFTNFAGHVPYGEPLFRAWKDTDILVITNLTDEISRNVFLGMGRGLPLILYRNAGTDRLVEENRAGALVPRGNVEALAEAFVKAAYDRNSLLQYARNGIELARNNTIDACHRRRADLAAALCGSLP